MLGILVCPTTEVDSLLSVGPSAGVFLCFYDLGTQALHPFICELTDLPVKDMCSSLLPRHRDNCLGVSR